MFNTGELSGHAASDAGAPYERTQFAPVSLVAASPHVLVVSENVPARTLSELVARLKSKDGKATYALVLATVRPVISAPRFCCVVLGVQVVHVLIAVIRRALTDRAAGHVDPMLGRSC